MDEKSLSHTSWNCKYHIVLVPKYRRKVIYGKLRKDIGKILRTLCDYKHVEIIEAHAMPDHIHMLVSIPPKLAVADFMGYLKGKSTLMIFERHANLKYKYGRRVFWAKGYYVNTVGGNEAKIRKYIQEQVLWREFSRRKHLLNHIFFRAKDFLNIINILCYIRVLKIEYSVFEQRIIRQICCRCRCDRK